MIDAVLRDNATPQDGLLAVSGASGAHEATAAEKSVLDERAMIPRAYSSLVGHLKEAQFPFAVALAALAVSRHAAFPPFDASEKAAPAGRIDRALATTVGYHYFEGLALVAAAD